MLRLKALRKSRGLSLKDLGEKLGVAESTVSLYENSKREAPYTILQKLSKIFNVSIDYLLANNENEISNSLNVPIIDSVSISNGEIEYCYSGESVMMQLGDIDTHFFLNINENSMAPQISMGDIAIIKKQNEIESGDVAAVIYRDSSIMLRKVITENSVIVLQAFDPAVASIIIGGISELKILGRVIQTIKKW